MPGAKLTLALLLLVAADLGYSFFQHHQTAIDGDLARIVAPAPKYQKVLDDPLGLRALLRHERHAGPNRFFAHWLTKSYFDHVPLLLQRFTSPVASVYLAVGLFKTLVQGLLLVLLALLASRAGTHPKRESGPFYSRLALPLALMAPLFVVAQPIYRTMGIIDRSVNYTAFYAATLALLLGFFFPFFNAYLQSRQPRLGVIAKVVMPIAALALALSGPLVPAVALLVCPALLFHLWRRQLAAGRPHSVRSRLAAFRKIDTYTLMLFSFFTLAALYSLYIGQFNSENGATLKPLAERYGLLLTGLRRTFSGSWGVSLLCGFTALNGMILWRLGTQRARWLVGVMGWSLTVAAAYVAMLPLGGYRAYRHFVLRPDTFIPVALCLIFCFAASSTYILGNTTRRARAALAVAVVALLVFFSASDLGLGAGSRNQRAAFGRTEGYAAYRCERRAMEALAASTEETVPLAVRCPFMSWQRRPDAKQDAVNNILLRRWRVLSPNQSYRAVKPGTS